MTVKELFSCLDTICPMVFIYDYDDNLLFQKHSNRPLGRMKYFDKEIAWITRIDYREINIRLEKFD